MLTLKLFGSVTCYKSVSKFLCSKTNINPRRRKPKNATREHKGEGGQSDPPLHF